MHQLIKHTLFFAIITQGAFNIGVLIYSIIAGLNMIAITAQIFMFLSMVMFGILVRTETHALKIAVAFLLYYNLIIVPGIFFSVTSTHPMVPLMFCYVMVLTILLFDGKLKWGMMVLHLVIVFSLTTYDIVNRLNAGTEGFKIVDRYMSQFAASSLSFFAVWIFKQKFLNLNKELYKSATHDSLTGAYNIRKLNQGIDFYKQMYDEEEINFSVIMIDMDNFKKVNDTLGHDTGDDVLSQFVALANKFVRNQDILARYGGDEFAMLLPACDKTKSLPICERILSEMDQLEEKYEDIGLSFSAGIADYKEALHHKIDIFKLADCRMYAAKSDGRNRINIDGCEK